MDPRGLGPWARGPGALGPTKTEIIVFESMEKVRTEIRRDLEGGAKEGIGPDALSVIRRGVQRISQEAPDGPLTHRLRMGVYYYDEPIE